MKSLDDWGGEKNATSVEQHNNAYVSKLEHDKLLLAERYRKEWSDIASDDVKAIKSFIDRNVSSSAFVDFMETAEKKTSLHTTGRIPPQSYVKWLVIKGESEYKSLGDFMTQLIDAVYENHKKKVESKNKE